jgi:hypothetical protein
MERKEKYGVTSVDATYKAGTNSTRTFKWYVKWNSKMGTRRENIRKVFSV